MRCPLRRRRGRTKSLPSTSPVLLVDCAVRRRLLPLKLNCLPRLTSRYYPDTSFRSLHSPRPTIAIPKSGNSSPSTLGSYLFQSCFPPYIYGREQKFLRFVLTISIAILGRSAFFLANYGLRGIV